MDLAAYPAATVSVDLSSRVMGWNPAAERLLGWSAAEVIGQPYPLTCDPATMALATRLERIAAGGTWTGLLLRAEQRRDGAWLTLDSSAGPLRDEQNNIVGMIEVLGDASPRLAEEGRLRADEERLGRQREQIELQARETQRLESLAVLAGGLAHDFNNLLTLILGHTSLAELTIQGPSPVRDHLHQIEKAALRAADLCKQMLAYAGKGRYLVSPVDLNTIVQTSQGLLQLSISPRAQLLIDLAANLPTVLADASQLQQVLVNLVVNASEALGDREGAITVQTGVHETEGATASATRFVFLQVRDNGCGMDMATMAHIFDPFFSTKFIGRGLGLSAVQGIVRGHHGHITVDSTLNVGSTFRVLLPLHSSQPNSGPAGAASASADWQGQGAVLVVDDEDGVRIVAARMLETMGFEVVSASSGQQAIDLVRAQGERLRLVVLDLTMPGKDGPHTLTELRQLKADLPVILMSGYHEQELSRRFAGQGFAGFLQKPFKREGLLTKVRSVLG